jgi:hypothetical protein
MNSGMMRVVKHRAVSFGLGLALLVGMMSCAQRPPALPASAARDSLRVAQDESFDPLSMREDDLIKLPESRLKVSTGTSEKGAAGSGAGRTLREAAGFRVQLIATESEMQARQTEQEALLDFQQSVYLSFDPPNYKVRVGDCITRADANALLNKATSIGYGDSWVVQCRVKVTDR